MRRARIVGLLLSAGVNVMLGCGGSDGRPLQLAQTTPTALATAVATDVVVTAEFDAPLNDATVTTSSFRLARDGAVDVPGRVTVDSQLASFTPASALGLLSAYTATVTTEVESAAGQALAMNHSWSFRTRDGQWGDARLIEISNAGYAGYPQLAIDPGGDVVAVWMQSDGIIFNIWANRFTPATGWGTAELIETDDTANAGVPHVALDTQGNAIAAWSQGDGVRENIWANRFTPATGWGTAELIETDDAGSAVTPEVAFNANGDASVVWLQADATRLNVWANRFTVATGWGTPELIETDNAGNASFPKLAVDANDNIIAVWAQGDGIRSNLWANRFTVATGWGTAELIETDNAGSAGSPKLAVGLDGDVFAVWPQGDGTRNNLWANRFTAVAGWGAAELIEANNVGDAAAPCVAVDPDGDVIAIWQQADGPRYDLWVSRFTSVAGWGTPELFETDDAGSASGPQLAFDPQGNAVAVWSQEDGTRQNIYAKRFTVDTGWGAAELVETNDTGAAGFAQLVIAPDGNASAVWFQSDSTRFSIWANRFE